MNRRNEARTQGPSGITKEFDALYEEATGHEYKEPNPQEKGQEKNVDRWTHWLQDRMSVLVSRRDFLAFPFRTIQSMYNRVKELNGGSPVPENLMEICTDAISVIAMILVGIEGSKDKVLKIDLTSETLQKDLDGFKEKTDTLNGLREVFGNLPHSMARLKNEWQTYYEEECTTTINDDGDTEETCDHTWKEPYALTSLGINHLVLDSWNGTTASTTSTLDRMSREAGDLFHLKNEASMQYGTQLADTGSQQVLASVLYTGVGLTFIYSEEALDFFADMLRYSDRDTMSAIAEKIAHIVDANSAIKRRTLLKAGVAGFLLWQMRNLQKTFALSSTTIEDDTKGKVRDVLSSINIPPSQNFKRFFGKSPEELRAMFVDMERKLEAASNLHSLAYNLRTRVKDQVPETLRDVKKAIASFDAFFSYDKETGKLVVPPLLNELLMQAWATQEIMGYARSRNTEVYTRHIGDAASLFFWLTVASVAIETTALPITEKIRKAFKKEDKAQ